MPFVRRAPGLLAVVHGWALPSGIALGVAAGIVALGLVTARNNLAFHKPVKISSVLLGAPEGVVNGVVEWGTYAVHTRGGRPAWLSIDLQGTFRVGQVVVFGRGDAFHTDSTIPTVIELSEDGRQFVRAGACNIVSTQVVPCRVSAHGVPARFVRLVHPTHLVLSEVEVFPAP